MNNPNKETVPNLEDIRKLIRAESLRQVVLTLSAIALGLGIALVFITAYMVSGIVLLVLGIIAMGFAAIAPTKLFISKLP